METVYVLFAAYNMPAFFVIQCLPYGSKFIILFVVVIKWRYSLVWTPAPTGRLSAKYLRVIRRRSFRARAG